MKVTIKRFDKGLPLPEYKTLGAAALDLYARENLEIPAGWREPIWAIDLDKRQSLVTASTWRTKTLPPTSEIP